jgi:hypothetical protein
MFIKIGGKEYELRMSWGKLLKLQEKEQKLKNGIFKKVKKKFPGTDEVELNKIIDQESMIPIMLLDIWGSLKSKWPFLFRWRMVNKIFPTEILAGYKAMLSLIQMEDREGKNLN